ncbi:Coiled-coil domain-containing protein 51 [Blomia tropicalis]|nr:Coiled-coil domain-containing protein 51 [Blomia tropicalis]
MSSSTKCSRHIVKKSLIEAADHRKEIQADLFHLQEKIRESRYLLDQTPRDSDNFITLFTSQHNLTKKEDEFRVMLQNEIDKENKLFSVYSENTRKLHEVHWIRYANQDNN